RRHRDPLDGQTLPVLGRFRRGTQLLVVLPDGSKRVIPAAWTDEGAGGSTTVALAPAGDLLGLCALVSALSARAGGGGGQAARQSPCKEDSHAACAAQSAAGPGSGATAGRDRPASRGGGRRGGPGTRGLDRQDGRPAGSGAGQGGRR